MRLFRIYQPSDYAEDQSLELDARASHYLLHVLRVKPGTALQLFDGAGQEATAVVSAVHRKTVVVRIEACVTRNVTSPLKIHLLQGVCRGEKMDFAIQKAVELGVEAITPLLSERCQLHLDAKRQASRLAHWQQVIISACEQSGRTYLPTLHPFLSLTAYQANTHAFVLSPTAQTHFKEVIPTADCDLLIGPEGGFSEAEMRYLQSTDVQAIALGPRILRSETAGLAAIAVLQGLFGDFN